MSDGAYEMKLDPARPTWPGVLVVGPDAFIQVAAGEPRNFADSRACAERIVAALGGDEEREAWCRAHNVTIQYRDGRVLLRSPSGRISLERDTRVEAIEAGMDATKDWVPSA